MATEKIIGRASLGVFLLRYGSHFPYTSLLIQSLKASHYISLERNIEDLKVFKESAVFPIHSVCRLSLKT